MTRTAPDTIWAVPDDLWPALSDIRDEFYPARPTGRPRGDLRRVADGIIYRMRTGVQWNRLPAAFGSDTTVHRWFQRFVQDGVFERLWTARPSRSNPTWTRGSTPRPPGMRRSGPGTPRCASGWGWAASGWTRPPAGGPGGG